MLILYFILFAPLLVAIISYAFFWYEIADREHHRRLKQMYPQTPLPTLLIRSVFVAWLTQLFVIATYPLFLFKGLWKAEDNGPVLIFIHGIFHNGSAWVLFRRWLGKAGFKNFHPLTYECFFHGYEDTERILKKRIREIAARYPGRPVFLIGHSLGGLYIRSCLTDGEIRNVVSGVVTLGAPHQGSRLAAFGIGRMARKIRYQSPFIRKMNQNAVPQGIPFLSLSSPLDNMVLPPKALKAPDNADWQEESTVPVNHIRMLYDRRIAERVIEFVREFFPAPEAEKKASSKVESGHD